MATQLIDEAGTPITDEDGVLIEVEEVGTASIWSHTGIPAGATLETGDTSLYTLGTVMSFATAGTVNGVWFYRTGSESSYFATGRGVGLFRVSDQALLASASGPAESGSGWRYVAFAAPVAVAAGTQYVIAAQAQSYLVASGLLTSSIVAGWITAPASSVSGGNGRLKTAGSLVYPSETFGSGCYFIDVDFSGPVTVSVALSEAPDSVSTVGALAIAGATAATTAGDAVASSGLLSLSAFVASTAAGDTLASAAGGVIAGNLAATERADALAASAGLALAATLASTSAGDTVSAAGSVDHSDGTVAVTTADDTLSATAAIANTGTVAVTTNGDAFSAAAGLLISGAANPLEGADTCAANGGSDAVASLWPHVAAPGSYDADLNDLTGGTVFYFTAPGQITDIWVYRTGQEWWSTGRQVGLYSIAGVLLASGTGGAETAGWNKIALTAPLNVAANTPYVAAALLYTYQSQTGAFSSEVARGAIRAPATDNTALTGSAIGNGRYVYGANLAFPSGIASGVSVFVDVEFTSASASAGALAATEAADVVVAAAGLTISGTLSGIERPDTLVASTSSIAIVSAVERADTLSSAAALAISGSLAALAGVEKPDTLAASSTAGTTYYTRKNGSDSNPGTDASPKLTIGAGLALLQPGDSLIVGDGTWDESGLNASGTAAGGYKTIRAEQKGQAKIVTNGNCFGGVGVSYLIIDGFELTSGSGHGLEMSYSHHIKVLNCTPIGSSNSGISFTQSDFITIDSNEPAANAWASWYSGISIYQCRNLLDDDTPGPRIFIRKNRSHHNFTNSFFTFRSGTSQINVGDVITTPAGVSAVVDRISLSSGSWAAGTAAGQIGVIKRNTTVMAANANLQVGGVTKAVANSGYSGGPFTDGNGLICDDWQNNQISLVVITFSGGSTRIKPLDTITVPLSTGGTATYTVDFVERTSGTWAGANAAGRIGLYGTAGIADSAIASTYPVTVGGAVKVGGATVATVAAVRTAKENPPNYQFGAIVEDNVCYANGAKGIQIAWAENCVVRNNTTFGNNLDLANTGTWRGDTSVQDSPGTYLVNGIAWKSTAHASNADINVAGTVSTSGTVVASYLTRNAAPVLNDAGSYTNGGGNQWGVDPQFIDPANGNFHLNTGSPAINAGTSAYGFAETDIEGSGRTASTINLGAFEAVPGSLGAFAVTEARDLVAANGALALSATLATTEAPDALAARGDTSGAVGVTEAADTLTAGALLVISGSVTATEVPDAGSSAAGLAIAGSLVLTEARDAVTSTGAQDAEAVFGSLAVAERGDTAAGVGVLPISGTASLSEAPDGLTALAAVVALTGYVAVTEARDAADGRGALEIAGRLTTTEAPDTLVVAVDPSVVGFLTVIEGGDGLFAAGEIAGVAIARLVVEDGTGIATANSYASIEALQIDCARRGIEIPSGDVAGALIRATEWLDGRYGRRYPGVQRLGRAQGLEWPRANASDRRGNPLPEDAVPRWVVQATILAALHELRSPGALYPQPTAGGVILKRRKVGPIEVEYDTSRASATLKLDFTAIDDVLASLLVDPITTAAWAWR